MINEQEISNYIKLVEKASLENNTDLFSKTRDVFQARIDRFSLSTQRYLEAAIIAEIGNNTFDHNFIFDEKHTRGAFFYYDEKETVVLADFGQGIKNSLKNVYNPESDLEALKLAFQEHVTSRNKENRGNGLKFVSENIISYNYELYYQSGIGCCHIDKNGMKFYNTSTSIIGCLAIIKF